MSGIIAHIGLGGARQIHEEVFVAGEKLKEPKMK